MPVATTQRTRVMILFTGGLKDPKKFIIPELYAGYSQRERYSCLLMVKMSFRSSVEGRKFLLSRSRAISSLKSS
jgi:hypothetical protein